MKIKYALFYSVTAETYAHGAEFFEAHAAHIKEFAAQGTMLSMGAFEEPVANGALGIFTTREAAEEFAGTDPFVVNGVVETWRVLEWQEVLDNE